MATRAELTARVLHRLGDEQQQIWTLAEIGTYLNQGLRDLALRTRVFSDWTYLENLPRGFSSTWAWEAAYVTFNYGSANYTSVDEKRLVTEPLRVGFANHTSPFEATDGWLSRAGASTEIPATIDLPASVTEIERALWDRATIDATNPRAARAMDARYQQTKGDVFAYLWRDDGVRTFRKVRVPAAQADTYTINGSWGILRNPIDLSSDTVTGTWGIPRRIPGQHPMGAFRFGFPRRPYQDGKNVRVEHWRMSRFITPLGLTSVSTESPAFDPGAFDNGAFQASSLPLGSALASLPYNPNEVCELPQRYALYLVDYALSRCYGRRGPGQSLELASHYEMRWGRGLARIKQRVERATHTRVGLIGSASARVLGQGPPRGPRMPWAYGGRVR